MTFDFVTRRGILQPRLAPTSREVPPRSGRARTFQSGHVATTVPSAGGAGRVRRGGGRGGGGAAPAAARAQRAAPPPAAVIWPD